MQKSLALLVSLSATASVAAKQSGDSRVSRETHATHTFLGREARLQPDVVAHSLAQVEEEWKDMAIAFVECNETVSDLHDMTSCTRAPKAFQKSCTTVIDSVFKASNGDRDNVQEYMSEVCEQGTLKGWKQEHCRSLASSLVNSMSLDTFDNRQRLTGSDLCTKFWDQFKLDAESGLAKERAEQEATEKKLAQARADAEKKAAEERAAAEKERIEQEAKRKVEAQARADAAKKLAEEHAAAEKKRIEQEATQKVAARAVAKQKAATAHEAEKQHMDNKSIAKKEMKIKVDAAKNKTKARS